MENLPFVVLQMIFNEMENINELIRCSWVCRNWRAAYEACKPKTLCLCPGNFLELNYRPFLTNEKLKKSNFFKTFSDNLRFLDSAITRSHFASIQKLIFFECDYYTWDCLVNKISFRRHINHFRNLEHLELNFSYLTLVDYEIDLPKLKNLGFSHAHYRGQTKFQIILKTPSLEALSLEFSNFELSKFKILFPHQLRWLQFSTKKKNLKLKQKFKNLECLVLYNQYEIPYQFRFAEDRPVVQLLSDDFLKSFPNLKFFFSNKHSSASVVYTNLEKQKRQFNLNDLRCLEYYSHYNREILDPENFQKYAEHREQLRYYPNELDVSDINKLMDCPVLLRYLKENYMSLVALDLGRVSNEALLIEFLRSTTIISLGIGKFCNLGQEFFDEIACFLTIGRLYIDDRVLRRLRDFSFLTKLNFDYFSFSFKQFDPREAILIILKKPSCYHFDFNYSRFKHEDLYEEDDSIKEEWDDRDWGRRCCVIHKIIDGFYCGRCGWTSDRDPNFSDAAAESVIKHLETLDNPSVEVDVNRFKKSTD